jgi:uncharacterized protein
MTYHLRALMSAAGRLLRKGARGVGSAYSSLFPPPSSLLFLALLAGCASGPGYPPRPALDHLPYDSPLRSRTLPEGDAWLRHHLMRGEAEQAIAVLRHRKLTPGDALLRALQEGLVLHQAGDFRRSDEMLAWAEGEADRRYTRSVTRAVGTLVVSDRVLAYTPSAGELVMIPYYRMLNHLALGDLPGAQVEARKAGALLARLGDDPVQRCREDGMVHYLAGLVHSAGGEANDALVSFRLAERAFRGCAAGAEVEMPAAVAGDLFRYASALGIAEVADSAAERYGLAAAPAAEAAGHGDLVLLLEHGFIAHRSSQALHVPILAEEVEGLASDDAEGVLGAAAAISARLLGNLHERAVWGSSFDDHPVTQWASALEGAYILRLAWPAYRRESLRPAAVRVLVNDSVAAVSLVGDLSGVLEREMERERPAIFARLVARGVAKYLLSRELERKAEEKGGEVAGFVTGRLANLVGNELERADTRGWSLLPDRISMARLRLPAGEYAVRVETLSAAGEVIAVRDLGRRRVLPGNLALLSQRVWEGEREAPLREAVGTVAATERPDSAEAR